MRRLTRIRRPLATPGTSRALLVVAATVLLAGMTVAILGTALAGWRFGMTHTDLPTRINTVVAVCAFVLVAATLIVALLAYLAATGRPDLQATLRFRFSDENEPVVEADAPEDADDWTRITPFRQTECEVVLHNRSRFAARNPGIRVVTDGLGGLSEQPGWATVAWGNMIGPTAFQWDGGADYIIHGKWSRTLPRLNFDGAIVSQGVQAPGLVVVTAADGFGPIEQRIPVTVLYPDQYAEWSARRAAIWSQTADEQIDEPS